MSSVILQQPDKAPARVDGAGRTAADLSKPRGWTASLRRGGDLLLHPINANWAALDRELDHWRKTKAAFWWRDDDAVEGNAALDRLLTLRQEVGLPLGLSVIPAAIDPMLAKLIRPHGDITILQHGWDHTDHGAPGGYKAELSDDRDPTEVEFQLSRGQRLLGQLFGEQALPVLTPPFDYLAQALVKNVRRVGFRHISVHGDFTRRAISSRNVHADLIDWREERAVSVSIAVRSVIAALRLRRFGLVQRTAPIGIKTHHLQHDEAVWTLTRDLLQRLSSHPAVLFPPVAQIFA